MFWHIFLCSSLFSQLLRIRMYREREIEVSFGRQFWHFHGALPLPLTYYRALRTYWAIKPDCKTLYFYMVSFICTKYHWILTTLIHIPTKISDVPAALLPVTTAQIFFSKSKIHEQKPQNGYSGTEWWSENYSKNNYIRPIFIQNPF